MYHLWFVLCLPLLILLPWICISIRLICSRSCEITMSWSWCWPIFILRAPQFTSSSSSSVGCYHRFLHKSTNFSCWFLHLRVVHLYQLCISWMKCRVSIIVSIYCSNSTKQEVGDITPPSHSHLLIHIDFLQNCERYSVARQVKTNLLLPYHL